jgi:hypothetical protein
MYVRMHVRLGTLALSATSGEQTQTELTENSSTASQQNTFC